MTRKEQKLDSWAAFLYIIGFMATFYAVFNIASDSCMYALAVAATTMTIGTIIFNKISKK